eukprot:1524985-Pleurochrysis_carterae.AAC.2
MDSAPHEHESRIAVPSTCMKLCPDTPGSASQAGKDVILMSHWGLLGRPSLMQAHATVGSAAFNELYETAENTQALAEEIQSGTRT